MHDAIGRGSQEGDAEVEPGGEHKASLVHDASWRLPDGHLEHICRTIRHPIDQLKHMIRHKGVMQDT